MSTENSSATSNQLPLLQTPDHHHTQIFDLDDLNVVHNDFGVSDRQNNHSFLEPEFGSLPKSQHYESEAVVNQMLFEEGRLSHRDVEILPTSGNKKIVVCHKPIKIFLLGITGHGKSATSNFLTKGNACKESSEEDPCTKQVQTQTSISEIFWGTIVTQSGSVDLYVRFPVTVYDTPGLNESEFLEEVKNTKKIVDSMAEIGYISMVLICVQYQIKRDPQIVSSFGYYKKVLQSIFDSDNWGIVITKFSGSLFARTSAAEFLKSREQSLGRCFDLGHIPHIFFFNHHEETTKYQQHNEETRNNILKICFMMKDRDLRSETLKFPLPPRFQEKQKSFLQTAESTLKPLKNKISQASQALESELTKLSQFQKELNELSSKLTELLNKRLELQKVRYAQPIIRFGSGTFQVFTFRERIALAMPLGLSSSSGSFLCHAQLWNCRYKLKVLPNNFLEVEIIPFWWTATLHPTGNNWYFQLEISFNGESLNAVQIREIDQECQILQNFMNHIRKQISQLFQTTNQMNSETYEHFAQRFNSLFYIQHKFSKEYYSYQEFKTIFVLLKQLEKNSDNLSSFDFRKIPDFETALVFDHQVFTNKISRAKSQS